MLNSSNTLISGLSAPRTVQCKFLLLISHSRLLQQPSKWLEATPNSTVVVIEASSPLFFCSVNCYSSDSSIYLFFEGVSSVSINENMHSNRNPSLKIRLHFVVFYLIEPFTLVRIFCLCFSHELLEVSLYQACKITYVRLLVASGMLIPELALDILWLTNSW